tara:strand:- start:378 stop:602 length:225 start_codon:yes stop_codon:yes gene_type:complete
MSEKTVRELERELKAARVRERKEHTDKVTVSRDYSIGGIDRDTTVEKKNPDSADIPDAILLPKNKRNKRENIPF